MKAIARGVRSFGRFWWEFLVGDSPVIFFAVLAIVAVALLLRHHSSVAVVVLPLMAIATLVTTVMVGRNKN
jgi:hypothetical protein